MKLFENRKALERDFCAVVAQPGPLKVVILSACMAMPCYGLDAIPDKSGVSGFINLGLGLAKVESNFISSTFNGNIDLGDERVDSLSGSPDSETLAMPVAAFELAYTFASSGTQIYFGNRLEDYVRFDLSTSFGVRQNMGKAGIVAISALQAPIATKVWRDPYRAGETREDTNRDSSGFRVEWDKILGSGFELRYSDREVDIDNELSGTDPSLGLTLTEIASLDRNGDNTSLAIRYRWKASNKNLFMFSLSTTDHDRDGEAMSYDGNSVEINNIHTFNQRIRLVTNLVYGKYEYDTMNPIYGQTADKDQIGFSTTVFYAKPFGIDGWIGNAGVVHYREDSDIDFFDSSVSIVNVGMLTRF